MSHELLLFGGVTYVTATDSGSGTDTPTLQNGLSLTDSGSGTDAPSLSGQVTVTESGASVDSIISVGITIADQGNGDDEIWDLTGQLSVQDIGSGSDAWVLSVEFTASDVGGLFDESVTITTGAVYVDVSDSVDGSDLLTLEADLIVVDAGAGSDAVVSVSFTVNDSATGVDAPAVTMSLSVSDSASGSDVWSLSTSFTVIDSGALVDAVILQAQIILTDSGAGADGWTLSVSFTASEGGTGSEAIALQSSFTISDAATGVDVVALGTPAVFVYDSGIGYDYFSKQFPVLDNAFGLDITYRMQGEISVDNFSLPHIQSIAVTEPSIFQDLPVMDALPYRKQLGKRGRSITIRGWTDSLSTLENLRGYDDGAKHLLLLPTGDSMQVHITDVRTPEAVANYDRYDYELDAVEVVD